MKNSNKIKLFSTPLVKICFSVCPCANLLICKSLDFNTVSAGLKVDPEILMKFVNDVCMKMYKLGKIKGIPQDKAINLHHSYFCAETIRDIYSNIISELQADSSKCSTNNIVSFGFLAAKSKPQRLKYIKMCENSPLLDYISTKKFNRYCKDSADFTSVAKLKKDYKYFIDLEGHTYSTKSYQFLASKRVYFSSTHNTVLKWEKNYLKPWENYIPVKTDLSDLMDKYQIIESDPELYKKIIENNLNLLQNQLSPELMLDQLVKKITSFVKFFEEQ